MPCCFDICDSTCDSSRSSRPFVNALSAGVEGSPARTRAASRFTMPPLRAWSRAACPARAYMLGSFDWKRASPISDASSCWTSMRRRYACRSSWLRAVTAPSFRIVRRLAACVENSERGFRSNRPGRLARLFAVISPVHRCRLARFMSGALVATRSSPRSPCSPSIVRSAWSLRTYSDGCSMIVSSLVPACWCAITCSAVSTIGVSVPGWNPRTRWRIFIVLNAALRKPRLIRRPSPRSSCIRWFVLFTSIW